MNIPTKQCAHIAIQTLLYILFTCNHHLYCADNNDLKELAQLLNLSPNALNGLTAPQVQKQIREQFTKPNITKIKAFSTDNEDKAFREKYIQINNLMDTIFGSRSTETTNDMQGKTDRNKVTSYANHTARATKLLLQYNNGIDDLMSDSIDYFEDVMKFMSLTIEHADMYFRNQPNIVATTKTIITNIKLFSNAIEQTLLTLGNNITINYNDIIQLHNNIKLLKNYTSDLSKKLKPTFQITDKSEEKYFDDIVSQLITAITNICNWANDYAKQFEAIYNQKNKSTTAPTKKSKNPFKRVFGKN